MIIQFIRLCVWWKVKASSVVINITTIYPDTGMFIYPPGLQDQI